MILVQCGLWDPFPVHPALFWVFFYFEKNVDKCCNWQICTKTTSLNTTSSMYAQVTSVRQALPAYPYYAYGHDWSLSRFQMHPFSFTHLLYICPSRTSMFMSLCNITAHRYNFGRWKTLAGKATAVHGLPCMNLQSIRPSRIFISINTSNIAARCDLP